MANVDRQVTSTDGTIVLSLLDYLRVLWPTEATLLLWICRDSVPATAIAVSLNRSPTYRASSEVYLQPMYLQPQGVGTSYIDPERTAQTRAKLARVPAVADQVLDAVPSAGLDREEFLESSSVSATLRSDILTFSVENQTRAFRDSACNGVRERVHRVPRTARHPGAREHARPGSAATRGAGGKRCGTRLAEL